MKGQKANSLENITWSELGKQNVQARKVFLAASSLSSAPNLVRGMHTRVCWAGREKRVPSVTAQQTKRKERLLVVYERTWSLSLLENIVPTKAWKDQVRVIFVWPWKMVWVSVSYLFYQPMDEKIKIWTLRFPTKENPNMEKALLDWPIVLQYDIKAKYRLISRKFPGMKFFHPNVRLTNQKPHAFVSVRQTNQIALFPFICCLFCSCVFISRSYEDRSN